MSMIIQGTSEASCWNCEKPTKNISLTFECHMCSEECDNEKFKEYMEACKQQNVSTDHFKIGGMKK